MDGKQQRASVVMLRGHGEDRLRQAIMQGLIRDDIAADVDEVLRQIHGAIISDAGMRPERITASIQATPSQPMTGR